MIEAEETFRTVTSLPTYYHILKCSLAILLCPALRHSLSFSVFITLMPNCLFEVMTECKLIMRKTDRGREGQTCLVWPKFHFPQLDN